MIVAPSTVLEFAAFFTSVQVGKTGLTVTAYVNGPSGNLVSAASAVEVDSVNQPGLYKYVLAGSLTATPGRYYCEFRTADATVDVRQLIDDGQVADWVTKINTIGSASAVFVSPVSTTGALSLIQGNDYKAADGRSIDFTLSGFPSFTSATVAFSIQQQGKAVLTSIAGSVLSSTQLRVELTAAQTALLTPGFAGQFDLKVTLSDGSIITPVVGAVTVAAKYTP